MMMMGLGMPNSQRPSEILQERFGHARDDRHAGRIGEGEADEDRADAERGDHRIDPELGDDEAVDDADHAPRASTMRIASRDRQLVMDDEAGDQHAVQARGIADREVELADDHREGQAAGDDHRQRGLVQHIDELPKVGKARGDRNREDDDHQHQPDDRAVAGEDAPSAALGAGRSAAVRHEVVGHRSCR